MCEVQPRLAHNRGPLYLAPTWDQLSAFWGLYLVPVRPLWGPLHLGPMWAPLGPILFGSHMGPIMGPRCYPLLGVLLICSTCYSALSGLWGPTGPSISFSFVSSSHCNHHCWEHALKK